MLSCNVERECYFLEEGIVTKRNSRHSPLLHILLVASHEAHDLVLDAHERPHVLPAQHEGVGGRGELREGHVEGEGEVTQLGDKIPLRM